jgi:hypothetical protein
LGRRPKASKGGNRGPEGALAGRGADLWGFCDGPSGGLRRRGCVFAADESGGGVRDRRIDIGWRIVRVKRREIGCIDWLRRVRISAGETCRRRMIVDVHADRVGGHDESIPAGSAVKLLG